MDTKEMPTLIEVTLKPFKSFKELGKGEFTADTTFIFCGYRYDEPNTFILWDNNLPDVYEEWKECEYKTRRKDYYQYVATSIRCNKRFNYEDELIKHIISACDKYYNARYDCSLIPYRYTEHGTFPELDPDPNLSYPIYFRLKFEGEKYMYKPVDDFVIVMEPYWGYIDPEYSRELADEGEFDMDVMEKVENIFQNFDELLLGCINHLIDEDKHGEMLYTDMEDEDIDQLLRKGTLFIPSR